MRSFLGVILHFIENWTLGSTILEVYKIHKNHTAQHLGDHLTKTCLDWRMTAEKITAVVTDRANKIDKALLGTWIKKLNNEIREEGESLDSDGVQLSPAPSSSGGK
ncbi:hypothetical protein NPIL_507881 [Nephila pilipes]|uniref:Uncharacterized protein n=1 Tax=Nephila pilipes TaxID=299642 RepID=A0A8X6MU67_NEPPI|nr:hypothetical protein NPIL_507881 [Nephila pilipes]